MLIVWMYNGYSWVTAYQNHVGTMWNANYSNYLQTCNNFCVITKKESCKVTESMFLLNFMVMSHYSNTVRNMLHKCVKEMDLN